MSYTQRHFRRNRPNTAKRLPSVASTDSGSANKTQSRLQAPVDPSRVLTAHFKEFIKTLDDNELAMAHRQKEMFHAVQSLYAKVGVYARAVINQDFLGMIKSEIKILNTFEKIDKILEIPEFTEVLQTLIEMRECRMENRDAPITAEEYSSVIIASKVARAQHERSLTINATEIIDIPPNG